MVKSMNGSLNSIKKTVFERIAEKDVTAKADLMSEFGFTSSSLTRLLEELTDEGWIVESGFGQSTGGRRPILYRINANHRYLLGLDISRLYSTLGLFDLKLNALEYKRWTMDESMTPERLVACVQEHVDSMLNTYGIARERVVGIGVGAVGPLNRESGVVLNPAYFNAAGWQHIPLRNWLAEATGLQVMLENGANAALAGEHWAYRGENLQHLLYVHVGIGLRSAMISGGQLVYGAVDMEGSIGQMVIQLDGPRLNSMGNYGALEAFVTVQAMEQQVRAQMKMGRLQLREAAESDPEAIHFPLLVRALQLGEPYIQELFAQSATYLGIGLGNLINILHPEKVILGGALINADDQYFKMAVATAAKHVYYSTEYMPAFTKGILQEHAVAVGAAVLVLKQMEMG